MKVRCVHCKARNIIDDELAGERVTCERCGWKFMTPLRPDRRVAPTRPVVPRTTMRERFTRMLDPLLSRRWSTEEVCGVGLAVVVLGVILYAMIHILISRLSDTAQTHSYA